LEIWLKYTTKTYILNINKSYVIVCQTEHSTKIASYHLRTASVPTAVAKQLLNQTRKDIVVIAKYAMQRIISPIRCVRNGCDSNGITDMNPSEMMAQMPMNHIHMGTGINDFAWIAVLGIAMMYLLQYAITLWVYIKYQYCGENRCTTI